MKANREKIQLAMLRACMNMTDIAKKAETTSYTVRNVVYGRSVSIKSLGRVAKALGVDPSEIMED